MSDKIIVANDCKNLILNDSYIRKSCIMVTEALHKGCDVIQMPNGDIIITELRKLTFQYSWDGQRGKMVRIKSGSRVKKSRANIDDIIFSNEQSCVDDIVNIDVRKDELV
jgi:hypothetical protein